MWPPLVLLCALVCSSAKVGATVITSPSSSLVAAQFPSPSPSSNLSGADNDNLTGNEGAGVVPSPTAMPSPAPISYAPSSITPSSSAASMQDAPTCGSRGAIAPNDIYGLQEAVEDWLNRSVPCRGSPPSSWDLAKIAGVNTTIFRLASELADADPGILLSLVCGAGQEVNAQALRCDPCPIGHFHEGSFGMLDRKGQCMQCPDGKTTSSTGSIKLAECACKHGAEEGGCWRKGYYTNRTSDECYACPRGGNCTSTTALKIFTEDILPLDGYWRPNNLSLNFTSCAKGYRGSNANKLAKQRCRWNHTANATKRECALGYTGPLCMVCDVENGYSPVENGCKKCESDQDSLLGRLNHFQIFIYIFLPACGLYYLLIIIMSFCTYLRAHKRGKVDHHVSCMGNAWDQIVDQIVILVSWAQILSLIPVTFSSAPWPQSFQSLCSVVGVVNFDISKIVSELDCTLHLPYMTQLKVHMLLPVAIIAVTQVAKMCLWIGAKVASKLCGHCKPRSVARMKMFAGIDSMMFTLLLLIHPSLSQKLFTIFDCQAVDGLDDDFLVRDFTITCYSDEHLETLYIVSGGLIVFGVGVPMYLLYQLCKSKKYLFNHSSKESEETKHELAEERLGNFYRAYESGYYWMEIAILYYKVFLTGVLTVIAPGQPVQLLIALIVCFTYLIVISHLAPYAGDDSDRLNFLCTITLCLTILEGFFEVSFSMGRKKAESTLKQSAANLMGNSEILDGRDCVEQIGMNSGTYFEDPEMLGMILICVNALPLAYFVTINLFYMCSDTERKVRRGGDNELNQSMMNTKIVPGKGPVAKKEKKIRPAEERNVAKFGEKQPNRNKGGKKLEPESKDEKEINMPSPPPITVKIASDPSDEVSNIIHSFDQNHGALKRTLSTRQSHAKRKTQMRLQARLKVKQNRVLSKVPVFSSLSEKDISDIIEMTHFETFGRGDVLCRQGDVADKLYIIVSGSCKVTVFSHGKLRQKIQRLHSTLLPVDSEREVATLNEMDMFGEGCMEHISDGVEETRNATVTSIDTVTLLSLHKSCIIKLIERGVLSSNVVKDVHNVRVRRSSISLNASHEI